LKDGYCDKISYTSGEIAGLYLNFKIANRQLIGLYDIHNKLVDSFQVSAFSQTKSTSKPWSEGFGYKLTVNYQLPNYIKSGLYLIDKKVPLIVKNDAMVDITYVYPSNTINAYNKNGGKSMYDTNIGGENAQEVSFHRPLNLPEFSRSFFLNPLQLKYSQNFICDKDLDDYTYFQNTRLLIIPGHNEYWTRKALENFDRYVAEGGDVIVLSGNTMWWQVRYEGNRMICYKSEEDPIDDRKLTTVR
jgi:hypothetical protein